MVEIRLQRKCTFRSARIVSGFTIKDVSATLNISPRVLSRFERNTDEMPLDLAIKLLEIYKIPLSSLQF